MINRYMQMKYGKKEYKIEVTKEEFIKLMVNDGRSVEDAEFHAHVCEVMGSSIVIGDKLVGIKSGGEK